MKSIKINLSLLADISGMVASCLCFIHCWIFPLLLIFLPGLIAYNEMAHPVLCSVAILSTAPVLFKKMFRLRSTLFQLTLVFGNVIMLLILFIHDHLSFSNELILSTLGGLSMIYLHLSNLRMKEKAMT